MSLSCFRYLKKQCPLLNHRFVHSSVIDQNSANFTFERIGTEARDLSNNYWENKNSVDIVSSQDPLKEFLSNSKTRLQVEESDIKQVFQEWYLKKLETNKYHHFINELISSRYSRPWEWDEIPEVSVWNQIDIFPFDKLDYLKSIQKMTYYKDKVLNELTSGTTNIGFVFLFLFLRI